MQTIPAHCGFVATRKTPSAVVHGLTSIHAIASVKEHTIRMLVHCFGKPSHLQLADIYSLDQSLPQAGHEDRNAALLILHAVLKVKIKHTERIGRCSFATSMFILHVIEELCAWSDRPMAETLELEMLYQKVHASLLTTDLVVRGLDTLVSDRFKGIDQSHFSAYLSKSFISSLQDDGYTFEKYNDDIIVLTPELHVIYVHACQCTAQLYDEDDPAARWHHHDEDRLRLKVHDVPILGTFSSCFWLDDQR